MIESDTSSDGTQAQRLHIAASPDWQNLLTYFDLSREGFAFIILIVPDKDWAEACRQALERFLLSFRRKLLAVSFHSAEEFKNKLAEQLLSLHTSGETGAVWVAAAVPKATREYKKWAEAWRIAVGRLNQYRNPLRQQFNTPLLFVGAPWIQPILRETAPDLWSVRTLVVRIEPPSPQATPNRDIPSQSQTTNWDEGHAIDPNFALREAEKLRGKAGKELSLATMLHRAATGFAVRYRFDEACKAFAEAVELRRRFGAETDDLANSLSEWADVLIWKNDFGQAEVPLLEALGLYQQIGDAHGEAVCIRRLGDIAFTRFQLDEAQTLYKQALILYRQIGEVHGEANSIFSLGEIALRRAQFDEAQTRYEQVLLLYRKIGNVLGEANSIASLGDIAIRLSQFDEAQTRYEQALPLYKQFGDALGEANCIMSLGDIALDRSKFDEAQTRYEQALPLYRQIGNVLGEANCIKGFGDIALKRSQFDEAQVRYEQALPFYRQIGRVLGEANCIMSLGDIAIKRSQFDDAQLRYEEALLLYRQIGRVLGEANCIRSLGDIALERSEFDEAQTRYEQALIRFRQIDDVLGEANCIRSLGDIAIRKDDQDNGRRLYIESLEIYERIQDPYSIGWVQRKLAQVAKDDSERQRHLQAARAAWQSVGLRDLIKEMDEEFSVPL